MFCNMLKDRTGLTLIETMVVVVIVSIIAGSLLFLIIKSLHSYYTLGALNELSNNASFAIDELIQDLRHSDINTVTQPMSTVDPATGNSYGILIFASLTGPNSPTEADGSPNWQSVIVYYPFTTQTGTMQLRKYIYNDDTMAITDFPLLVTVTANNINLFRSDGTALVSFDRANGQQRVLANFLSTEDMNANGALDANENDGVNNLPMDNSDGVLDSGADYNINGDTVNIKLFLQKPINELGGIIQRRVCFTSNSAATLRN